MPRDNSGVYTLPAGINPVAVGTLITVDWANPTLDDVADALTDSLSRTGKGGMLVPLTHADGTKVAPGLAWSNEPTMGWYRAASGETRFVIANVDRTRMITSDTDPFQIWNEINLSWHNALYQDYPAEARVNGNVWSIATANTQYVGVRSVLNGLALRVAVDGAMSLVKTNPAGVVTNTLLAFDPDGVVRLLNAAAENSIVISLTNPTIATDKFLARQEGGRYTFSADDTVHNHLAMNQAAYDALGVYDANTIYYVYP